MTDWRAISPARRCWPMQEKYDNRSTARLGATNQREAGVVLGSPAIRMRPAIVVRDEATPQRLGATPPTEPIPKRIRG
jgi:hypothetical protein